jgi:hypothetical protein
MIARENRARPTLASPTRALPAWRLGRANGLQAGSHSIGFFCPHLSFISLQKSPRKKKRGSQSRAALCHSLASEQRRRCYRSQGGFEGYFEPGNARCGARDETRRHFVTRAETRRAHRRRRTRARHASGSSFSASRATRARARPLRAAPRRNRARGSGGRELLAKPTKHAPRWRTTRRGTRPRRTSSP